MSMHAGAATLGSTAKAASPTRPRVELFTPSLAMLRFSPTAPPTEMKH